MIIQPLGQIGLKLLVFGIYPQNDMFGRPNQAVGQMVPTTPLFLQLEVVVQLLVHFCSVPGQQPLLFTVGEYQLLGEQVSYPVVGIMK